MKQPKKLTYEHKKYLSKKGLDPKEWMLLSEDDEKYTYIHKETGEQIENHKL